MSEYKNGVICGSSTLQTGKGLFVTLRALLDNSKIGDLLVLHGVITPAQLRSALDEHRASAIPLGQILIQNKILSRRTLLFTLLRQRMLRFMAGGLLFVMSLGGFAKKSFADIADIPAKVSLASTASFGAPSAYPALFGSDEKRSENLTAFTKWSDMFARFDRTLKQDSSQDVIAKMKRDIEGFSGLSLPDMAEKVNRLMNKQKYIVDSKNWGKSDYWATPVEFLTRGGDCEDYAIAKYVALRALGVVEERMRIAIVHDNVKNIPHAILIVYTSDGALVLDNQNPDVLSADSLRTRYRPIFSINRQAWWLHSAPESTLIASAK